MLHKLAARKGPDGRPPPARYFSIDRVFRNETVDNTHLAEFHQVEGIIADYDLTLGGLMAVRCHIIVSFVIVKLMVLVHGCFLRQDGYHWPQVQASIQPLFVLPLTPISWIAH